MRQMYRRMIKGAIYKSQFSVKNGNDNQSRARIGENLNSYAK